MLMNDCSVYGLDNVCIELLIVGVGSCLLVVMIDYLLLSFLMLVVVSVVVVVVVFFFEVFLEIGWFVVLLVFSFFVFDFSFFFG